MVRVWQVLVKVTALFSSVCLGVGFSAPYCINLRCKVKDSRRADFLELIRENQKQTLANEQEALQYVVGEDVDIPNVFYIHEQFKSSEGFVFHRDTPHNANWQAFKASDPFEELPVTDFYHGTHEPTTVPIRDAYCLNVQLHIKQDVRDEFLRVVENNAKNTVKEPLCLQYVYGQDEMNPTIFHFHEEFTGRESGKEGFEAHTRTDHFGVWEEFVAKKPFASPPLVSFYRTL